MAGALSGKKGEEKQGKTARWGRGGGERERGRERARGRAIGGSEGLVATRDAVIISSFTGVGMTQRRVTNTKAHEQTPTGARGRKHDQRALQVRRVSPLAISRAIRARLSGPRMLHMSVAARQSGARESRKTANQPTSSRCPCASVVAVARSPCARPALCSWWLLLPSRPPVTS